MMKFRLADCVFEIRNLRRKQSISRLLPFLSSDEGTDLIYDIQYFDEIEISSEEIVYYQNKNFVVTIRNELLDRVQQNYKLYYVDDYGIPYAEIEEIQTGYMRLSLLETLDSDGLHEYLIPDLLQLDWILAKKKSLVLHSSFIEIHGKAILFSAPSGGGKSTQADLWKIYRDARIINGDKNVITKSNNIWMAYGSPFSGSSPYCLNEGYPIAAIVILDKALKNVVTEIGQQAFMHLLKQTIVTPWDPESLGIIMDSLDQVCNEIPVYHFSCTKDESAVRALEQIIHL